MRQTEPTPSSNPRTALGPSATVLSEAGVLRGVNTANGEHVGDFPGASAPPTAGFICSGL